MKFEDLTRLVSVALTLVLIAVPALADDAAAIAKGQSAVAKKLNDPASAKFSEVKVIVKGGKKIVCGRVTAKNNKGDYEGPKPFAFYSGLGAAGVAVIFGGVRITNDLLSRFAPAKGFQELCGPHV